MSFLSKILGEETKAELEQWIAQLEESKRNLSAIVSDEVKKALEKKQCENSAEIMLLVNPKVIAEIEEVLFKKFYGEIDYKIGLFRGLLGK